MVDKEVKRLSVDLSENMHNQAKAKAASEGLSLSDVIRSLLFGWLTKDKGAENTASK